MRLKVRLWLAIVSVMAVASACTGAPAASDGPTAAPSPTQTAALTLAPLSPAPTTTAAPTGAPPTPTVTAAPTQPPTTPSVPLALTSTVFAEGERIPNEFACDGADLQLPVDWVGTPDGTVELALIMDDPDARGFVHWVVVGIPAEAIALTDPLPAGARHGRNDFGRSRYDGPCPPVGRHTYVTTLYALSAPLVLGENPGAEAVRRAAADVTLATAVLNGTYSLNR